MMLVYDMITYRVMIYTYIYIRHLYMNIGKVYYAKRHNYKFSYKLSPQYSAYFGKDFLEVNAIYSFHLI